jgi:hypothetical protein
VIRGRSSVTASAFSSYLETGLSVPEDMIFYLCRVSKVIGERRE